MARHNNTVTECYIVHATLVLHVFVYAYYRVLALYQYTSSLRFSVPLAAVANHDRVETAKQDRGK